MIVDGSADCQDIN